MISDLYTIREWEKCIRSHGSTFEVKSKASRLFNRLIQSVHARSLSCSTRKELTVFREYNCITLRMLTDFRCENHVGNLLLRWSQFCNGLHILFTFG